MKLKKLEGSGNETLSCTLKLIPCVEIIGNRFAKTRPVLIFINFYKIGSIKLSFYPISSNYIIHQPQPEKLNSFVGISATLEQGGIRGIKDRLSTVMSAS